MIQSKRLIVRLQNIHIHVNTTIIRITPLLCSSSNITWSSILEKVTITPFQHKVGPEVTVPSSPLGTFFLFFTTSIIQHIVQETNRYAAECMGQEKYETWQKVTADEITAFMGFMILMSIVHLPCIADYWKRDEICQYIPITRRISRNRFFEIQRYLHFVDNSILASPGTPEYKKLGKIQPILDFMVDHFKCIFNLHKDVSVDEAMIPFKGRSSIKQYLPMKPVKRGFKVWMVADAITGYVSNFEVYTGKKGDKPETGLGSTVVKTLCHHIQYRYMKFTLIYTIQVHVITLPYTHIYT